MQRMSHLAIVLCFSLAIAVEIRGQSGAPVSRVYEFGSDESAETGWMERPGGFESSPAGSIAWGQPIPGESVPSNDQTGVQLSADPGQVAMIHTRVPVPFGAGPFLLRMDVWMEGEGGTLTLAALKGSLETGEAVDGSIASLSVPVGTEPHRSVFLLFEPDTPVGVTPVIQLAQGSNAASTVHVDRLEILSLSAETAYAAERFGANEPLTDTVQDMAYDFRQLTLERDGWSHIPGGFDHRPSGTVVKTGFSPEQLPASTDRFGIRIRTEGGELSLLHPESPVSAYGNPVLMRLYIQSLSPDMQVALAAMNGDLSTGAGIDGQLAAHIPATSASLQDGITQLTLLYHPGDSQAFTPIIQVFSPGNHSGDVLIDRLEIVYLNADTDYPGTWFMNRADDSPPLRATPTPPPSTPLPHPTATPVPPRPTATPNPPGGVIVENEPNDESARANPLPALGIGDRLSIRGTVSSGGIQNDQFTGDLDYYQLTLTEACDVTATLNWDANADLDVVLFINEQIIGGNLDSSRPTRARGTLAAGVYHLVVGSKDQPSAYTLDLQIHTPTTPRYPNDVSLLDGPYAHFERISLSTSRLHGLYFDGAGNFTSWRSFNYNSQFSDIPWWFNDDWLEYTGTYEIRYPFLVLHYNGQTEYTYLVVETPRLIYINGVRYR